MKKILIVLPLLIALIGCTPVEKQAYNTIVAAKAFLDAEKVAHPECATGTASTVCADLNSATKAKDALIDAVEIYCSGTAFESGGACQPPAKGTPVADQAVAKLKAAIALYNQTATDLKSVL